MTFHNDVCSVEGDEPFVRPSEEQSLSKIEDKWTLAGKRKRPVVDVIKLILEEFWKIWISPSAETARIGHLKSYKNSIVFTF